MKMHRFEYRYEKRGRINLFFISYLKIKEDEIF